MRLRGLERLVGDEPAVARRVLADLREHRFPVRVGIANGRFSAEMAARATRGKSLVIPPGGEPALIKRFPVSVLPEPDSPWREMKRRLRLFGLYRLGEVAALGKMPMQAQFGKIGLEAWLMASGQASRLKPLPVPVEVMARRQFEPALEAWEEVRHAATQLAAELARDLQRQGIAAAFLDVTWETEGAGPGTMRTGLRQPTGSTSAIASLLVARLTGRLQGPLAELTLRAEGLAREPNRQVSLFAPRKRDERLGRLARDLEERIGRPAIVKVAFLGASPLEERTYELVGL